jgi:hypothetical protein
MLPAGKAVVYATPQDDDIPNQPFIDDREMEPVLAARIGTQAEDRDFLEASLGSNLHKSYADRFFLPQYVAFDDQNQLLAGDLKEAFADIQAMRRYLLALNSAVCLAPYMVVDEEFQSRRYGILGQLVNQGRALATYQVRLLCQTIKTRSASHGLDRGLCLSLPYFNDETLRTETYKFDIIPTGWVMFVPAFVVLAARAEAAKVLQNTHLSLSTRKALVQELCILERAFLR